MMEEEGGDDGVVLEVWNDAGFALFAQRIVATMPIASANRNAWIVLNLRLTGGSISDFVTDFEKSPIPSIR
jgi:hypothetical protein